MNRSIVEQCLDSKQYFYVPQLSYNPTFSPTYPAHHRRRPSWPYTRNTQRSLLPATLRLVTLSLSTTTAMVVKRASSLALVSTSLADKSSKSNSKPQTKFTKHGTPLSPASGEQSLTPDLSSQNSAPLSAESIGDRISPGLISLLGLGCRILYYLNIYPAAKSTWSWCSCFLLRSWGRCSIRYIACGGYWWTRCRAWRRLLVSFN